MNVFSFDHEHNFFSTKYFPVGVIVCDDRDKILRADLKAITGSGSLEKKILGKNWHDQSWRFYRPDGTVLRAEEHPIRMALDSGMAQSEVLTWVFGPGQADRIEMVMNVFPFPAQEDFQERAIVFLTDLGRWSAGAGGLEKELLSCRQEVMALLQASRDSTVILDASGRVLAVGGVGSGEYGQGPAELVGRGIEEVYPEDLARRRREQLERVFGQGLAIQTEETFDDRVFEIAVLPMFDWQERVVKAAVIARDVTVFSDLAALRAKNLDGLDKIQEIARMGNWTWDLCSNQVSWSKTMCRMLEINPEELGDTYEAFLSMVHPEDKSMVSDALARALFEEKNFEMDHRLVTPEGQELYVQTIAEIFYDQDGEPIQVVGTVQDITPRKLAEIMVTDNEALMRAIVETAVEGIITINSEGVIESFNSAASKIFGYRVDEAVGQNIKMLMPEPHRDRHDQYLADYLATGQKRLIGLGRELEGQHKNGSLVPIDLAVSEVVLKDRRIFTGIIRDISERKNAERELRIKESAIQSSINAIIFCDMEGIITFVNEACLEMWAFEKKEDIVGQAVPDLFDNRERGRSCLELVWKEGEWFGELTAAQKNGQLFEVQISGSMVADDAGRPITAMLSMVDITEQKEAEKQLVIQAIYDKLTGLYNRRHLMELLEKEVSAARRHGLTLCLSMADLDHFKGINDRYGHRAGDEVLARFGLLIRDELRAEDIAGRYGGEEFVFIMPHTSLEAAKVVLERIRTKLEKIVFYGNKEQYVVTVSIGAVKFDHSGMNEMELLDLADQALYKAKKNGRNQVVVYENP